MTLGEKIELDNGFWAVVEDRNTETTYGSLKVNVGSVHEEPDEKGYAHLLEHITMQGVPKKYEEEEAERIKASLGDWNATTRREDTLYHADFLKENGEDWLRYVLCSSFRPSFNHKTIEQERNRALEEIKDKKGSEKYLFQQSYRENLFQDSPVLEPVTGIEEVVENADKQDLIDFHHCGYYPNNASLIMVGSLPENLAQILEGEIGDLEEGEIPEVDYDHIKQVGERSEVEIPGKRSLVQMGFHVPGRDSSDYQTIATLNRILGGGPQSRLHKEISEDRGLAYSVSSKYQCDLGTGIITINTKVEPGKENEATNLILEEITDLRKDKVENKELDRAIGRTKYNKAKRMETNEGINSIIALEQNNQMEYKDYLQDFDQITQEQLKEVAQKYFPEEKQEVSIVVGKPAR